LFNSQVTPYAVLTGPYGYVAAGAALRDAGYGFVNLTWPGGNASNVVAAYMIWSILNASVPPSYGTINGHNVTGTWTAYATPSPCWSPTYIYTFVADVTTDVVYGSNNLTSFPSGTTSGADPWVTGQYAPLDDSASLVVIYDNSSNSTLIHQVTVYTGASPVGTPAPNSETAQLNFSKTNSTHAKTTYIVADGQLPGNYAQWNSTTINTNAFPGDDPHESHTTWSFGNLSDTRSFAVNVTIGSNNTTASIDSIGTDCFTWVGQVLSVGVAAKKGPYAVDFQEQGLPSGTSWNVTTHSVTKSGTVVNGTSSISFSLNNGSYSYKLGAVPGYANTGSGAFKVRGGPVFIRVIFHALLYAVTFNETGLPGSSTWWVNVTNTTQRVSQNLSTLALATDLFDEANGTYSYIAGEIGLYLADPGNGTFKVDGANVVVTVTFVPPPLFNVTIAERGLPTGTTWGADSDTNWGYFYNTTSSISFVLRLPNTTGNTDVLIPIGVTGYKTVYTLSFGVAGKAETVQVNYSKLFTATLAETGLPLGTYWEGDLTNALGAIYASSNTAYLNYSVLNGTYTFSVDPVWGYTATPATGTIVVNGANISQAIVFTHAPTYSITFNETGLASGAAWTVELSLPNGTLRTLHSTLTSITFIEPNGTYTAFPSSTGYTPSPADLYFGVAGSNVSYTITFTKLFLTTFTETGLPSGTYWELYYYTGYLESDTPTILVWVPNGTWSWSALTTGGYSPSPNEGTFTIQGSNVAQTIAYTSPTSPTYTVTFTESGLPSLTNWSVDYNYYTEYTNGTSLNFTEANGTLDFSVSGATGYTPTPATGSITVHGGNVSQTIDFSQSASSYTVIFTESGLPNGATWYVNITGQTGLSATVSGSSGASVQISLLDGAYTYEAATNEKNWITPSGGSFTVAGSGLSEPVPFTSTSVKQFLVTFTESGLPNGATWYVNITGQPKLSATVSSSSGTSVSISLPNATYDYTAATGQKGWTTPSSSSFTVAGGPLNQPVPFTSKSVKQFDVTFTESGLPSGAAWYVNITGQPALTATVSGKSGTELTSALINGSYTYSAATNWKNWTTSGGSFSIAGLSQSLTVTFTSVGGPASTASTQSSFPTVWLAVGLILAALLLLIFFIAYRRRKKDDKQPPPPASPPPHSP